MRLLIILFFISVAKGSYAQTRNELSEPEDSLKKYSYLISGTIRNSEEGTIGYKATGFFIKTNDNLLFITAKHVLSGCKYYGETNKIYPTSMRVYLNNDTSDFIGDFITINISSLRDTGLCYSDKSGSDFSVVVFPNSIRNRVNSIEKFITPDVLPKFLKGMFMYGYSLNKNNGASKFKSNKFQKQSFRPMQLNDGLVLIDSNNLYVNILDAGDSKEMGGYSGAPVFIRGASGDIYFWGLFSGNSTEVNEIMIVKEDIIVALLKTNYGYLINR